MPYERRSIAWSETTPGINGISFSAPITTVHGYALADEPLGFVINDAGVALVRTD